MNLAEQVKEKLAEVEVCLTDRTPGLAGLLRTIHTQLKKDPEIVTLLSEEDCAILVNGLKEYTKTEISTRAVKKKGGKSLKQMTLADL